MRSNYKKLGPYIQEVNERNTYLEVDLLLGVSIKKKFIPSIANTVGTDMSRYKIVRRNQFAYGPVTSRNGDKISIALLEDHDAALISQSYKAFEVIDHEELMPEYLMMWFRREEFDRYARYMSHGSTRETFDWDEMCDVELPIPSIDKQREIVAEYNAVVNRIELNEQINQMLEETAKAIYRQWFEEFEFAGSNEVDIIETDDSFFDEIPEGWNLKNFKSLCSKIGSGATPRGGKFNYKKSGISLIRSQNVFDFNFDSTELAFIDEKQAEKLNNVEIKPNDILLNITGASVARCTIVPNSFLPARVNQHVSIIRPKKSVGTPFYFLFALCSTNYKRRLLGMSEAGSTRQAITKSNIQNLEVLVPPLDLRKKFDQKVQKLFSYKDVMAKENSKLNELKTVLLSKMTQIEAERKIQIL